MMLVSVRFGRNSIEWYTALTGIYTISVVTILKTTVILRGKNK